MANSQWLGEKKVREIKGLHREGHTSWCSALMRHSNTEAHRNVTQDDDKNR